MTHKVPLFHEWSFIHRCFYRIVTIVIPRWTRFFFQFDVHGIANSSKFKEGFPVIYCGNHQSHLDSVLLGSAIVKPYGSRKALAFMASGKAMRENKFFGLVKYLAAFPVFKENPQPALNNAARFLKNGYAVFISPQGKRVGRTPYHDFFNLAEEGRTGVGRIILKLNGKVPIVPYFIHGAYEALGHGKTLPKYGSYISVRIGIPLFFSEYSKPKGWKEHDPFFYVTAREIVNKIMCAIRDLMLVEEKYYFTLLEKKFKVPIEKISISKDQEYKFNRILTKLSRLPPSKLKEYLEYPSKM